MLHNPIAGIGQRLTAIRLERKLSPSQMADWLGVQRTRYVNWEKEQNRPSEEKMALLCEYTGVTMDYIYRGILDAVPMALAIRLKAREMGEDPDAPEYDPQETAEAFSRGLRKV